MNKSWFYLGAIGSLATLITSCGGDGGKPATPAASPSAAASPAAAPAPVAAVPPKAAPATPATAPKPAVAATAPTVPATSTAKKSVSVDVAAGLIPPTDGESWAKTVAKGRPDPFASLALQPIEVAEKDPLDPAAVPQQKSTKIASNPTKLPAIKSGVDRPLPSIKVATNPIEASNPTKASNSTKGRIATRSIGDSTIPRTGINRALPKITVALGKTSPVNPNESVKGRGKTQVALRSTKASGKAQVIALKPTTIGSGALGKTQVAAKPEQVAEKALQAMAVEVSGIIEVNGKTQVIVKLPNESFSRYIEVGERVGGNILVKRVEGQNTLSPTVILEEGGVETQRKVGDKSSSTEPTSTPKS
jgi:hypothetical protein